MNFLEGVLVCCALFELGIVISQIPLDAVNTNTSDTYNIIAGYVPGLSGMPVINETNCVVNDVLRTNPFLSNSLECARTCHDGDQPKICYYELVVEHYPVYGQACDICTPDSSTNICSNCQCVLFDGVQRSALVVNRMYPGPSIQVCLGDSIVVDVVNRVTEEQITIHWHGILQYGTQINDGVPFVTQCPIPSGNTYRYQYYAHNSGTHFWHSHVGLQKLDGIAGSLIVREPANQDPNSQYYDYDLANHVIFLSDWMNENPSERYPGRRSGKIGQFADAVLINGRGTYTFGNGNTTDIPLEVITVDADGRYRFRLVNAFCTVCPGELTIQGHNMTVIATDGMPIQPVNVTSIISYAGERYDFVIHTNQTPGAYWIQLRALELCSVEEIQQLGILQYSDASTTPFTEEPTYSSPLPSGVVLNPTVGNCEDSVPDAICVNQLQSYISVDANISRLEPDISLYLPITLFYYNQTELFRPNTYNRFIVPSPESDVMELVSGISFNNPPSPLISQLEDIPKGQICDAEHLPVGCITNCTCTHVIHIPLHAVVEFTLVDMFREPYIEHPFHMHGYAFTVLSMGQPLGPTQNATGEISVEYVQKLQAEGQIEENWTDPPMKDTIAVPNNGFVILRIRADNPGYWMFHCHFVYHQVGGMELVLHVGEQEDLPPIPRNFPKCGNYMPEIIDINWKT